MIDFARIAVIAGDGGGGCGSFFRIKGKRYGKADGGDGGRGGDVCVEATRDLSTLEPYRYVKDYKAENGGVGLSNHRRGADGRDLVLKVPVGTEITISGSVTTFLPASAHSRVKSDVDLRDQGSLRAVGIPSSRATQNSQAISYDLFEDEQRVLVARGGEGGRGNAHLKDEYGRRPKVGEKGQEGEAVSVTLELKMIADVGIIGLPNAGKSTLLAKLTAARPKIAAYPFTTLEPNLGVLTFSGPVT
ncbi:MAG: GTPase, partial [Patescibacteria group bacterium]